MIIIVISIIIIIIIIVVVVVVIIIIVVRIKPILIITFLIVFGTSATSRSWRAFLI